MKITLLHPSRGRAKQAHQTLRKWLEASSGEHEIEHILSIDADDPKRAQYDQRFVGVFTTIIVGPNTNVVQATNRAAEKATGEIIIYLSDDFECPANWDELIVNEMRLHGMPDKWLLKVDDCLQKFGVDVLTIPIMSSGLMKELGYFWHPDYKSMFVDQDLFHTVKNLGAMYLAQHLKFPHLHYSNGKADRDETYMRSDANWTHGQQLYNYRKKQNFPR